MRVLVAEDELVTRVFLQRILSNLGHEVEAVKDGEAAWEALNRPDAPNLALLDWMMPGLTGVEVCRRLRERSGAPYTYVVLVTVRNEKGDLIQGFDAGVDDYVAKPFSPQEMEARLKAAHRILDLVSRPAGKPRETSEDSCRLSPRLASLEPLRCMRDSFSRILAQIGFQPGSSNGDPVYTAHTVLILRELEVWLDLAVYLSEETGQGIYRAMLGETSRSESELFDALAELLNMFQGAWKLLFEQCGFAPMTPLLPRVGPARRALAAGLPSTNYCFPLAPGLECRVLEHPLAVRIKRLGSIRPLDILAEPVWSPKSSQVMLNRGVALNSRYVEKIAGVYRECATELPRLTVIEPSSLAVVMAG